MILPGGEPCSIQWGSIQRGSAWNIQSQFNLNIQTRPKERSDLCRRLASNWSVILVHGERNPRTQQHYYTSVMSPSWKRCFAPDAEAHLHFCPSIQTFKHSDVFTNPMFTCSCVAVTRRNYLSVQCLLFYTAGMATVCRTHRTLKLFIVRPLCNWRPANGLLDFLILP